jgi:hypothetical protein
LFLRVNSTWSKRWICCALGVLEDVKGKISFMISTQPQSTKQAHNNFVWKVSLVE